MSTTMVDIERPASPTLETRKRKRENASEPALEIDFSLPEPPSKKALRKAKKSTNGEPKNSKTIVKDSMPRPMPPNDSNYPPLPQPDSPEVITPPSMKPPTITHSIWIGNLPFGMTKSLLRDFFTSNSQPPIPASAITRIHIPSPTRAAATRTTLKPQNKGFAYVDFSDHAGFLAALALSETPVAGRNVLVKDAKNFDGRPSTQSDGAVNGTLSKAAAKTQTSQKPPSTRVFVGNLGYDVTREDLRGFYEKCGEVVDVHVATFEDSGKCKGYAWVTFGGLEAARFAVQGWLRVAKAEQKPEEKDEGKKDDSDEDEGEADEHGAKDGKKATKTQKWFVNRIQGRPVRCEYAEDPSIRYKKRFGKDAPDKGPRGPHPASAPADENAPPPPPPPPPSILGKPTGTGTVEQKNGTREGREHPFGIEPGAGTDASKRRGRGARVLTEKDKRREAKAKEIADKTRYRSGAVTESSGSKVVFE